MTLEFQSEDSVIPLLQEIIHRDTYLASANYLLGKILLKKQDATGIKYIEMAIEQDSSIVIGGCQMICNFLKNQGKNNEAKSYQERADNHSKLILKSQQERSNLKIDDKLKTHNISDIEVDKLRQQLSHYPQIITAYLVQKICNIFLKNHFMF
ncbi:hypothetical protein [Nostoc sp.]|uniref:hypothetical protein n=1 Tax=Nostoc sp. TaxID=1180 RepID=UPI002FFC7903